MVTRGQGRAFSARGRHWRVLLLLRIGATLVLAFTALTACATPGAAPPPPRIKAPLPVFEGFTKLDLVTDFTARIELPGASVLPPRGRIDRWVIGHWRQEKSDGVGFMANAAGDRILIALAMTNPVPYAEWKLLRSYGPALFQETVRQEVTEGSTGLGRVRKVDVQPQTKADGTCARYGVEIDHVRRVGSGAEGPGLLLASGRICLHPDSPRIITLMVGQSIPVGGEAWDSIEIEMAPFLDNFQFRPLGVAWKP